MVRLVFRPYTQFRRTICTSVSLRASTRVSPGFTLIRHSSPSFGSQQICSYSNLSWMNDRSIVPLAVPTSPVQDWLHFHCASGFLDPNTRIYVRLLGPCFKTGQWKPFRQDRECAVKWNPSNQPWPLQDFVLQNHGQKGDPTSSLAERIVVIPQAAPPFDPRL
jgi:hypothetical protein